MVLGLRALLVLAAAVACFVLAFVVLLAHPHNEIDLLAWIGVATGAGLVAMIAPIRE
jgi:hypothetical protein